MGIDGFRGLRIAIIGVPSVCLRVWRTGDFEKNTVNHRYIALATVTNRDLPIGRTGLWELPERLKYEGKRPKMDYGTTDYGTMGPVSR